jgi:hypothetical protein
MNPASTGSHTPEVRNLHLTRVELLDIYKQNKEETAPGFVFTDLPRQRAPPNRQESA